MYQEQEKRLYYISNDEVDYERIELIDRQVGKTLHAISSHPLVKKKKIYDTLYTKLLKQLNAPILKIDYYEGSKVVSDGTFIIGFKKSTPAIYKFILLREELPNLIDLERFNSFTVSSKKQSFKSSFKQSQIIFLFNLLRQDKIIKDDNDTFIAEIISCLTGYSSQKVRQNMKNSLSNNARLELINWLEKLLRKLKDNEF